MDGIKAVYMYTIINARFIGNTELIKTSLICLLLEPSVCIKPDKTDHDNISDMECGTG